MSLSFTAWWWLCPQRSWVGHEAPQKQAHTRFTHAQCSPAHPSPVPQSMGNLAFFFHDSNGYSLQPMKFPQASLVLWIVGVVEPCYTYVYVHIGMPLQEIPYFIAAARTGAPGQVPGDVTETVASWLKDFLQEVLFCMANVVSDPVYPRPLIPIPPQLT